MENDVSTKACAKNQRERNKRYHIKGDKNHSKKNCLK